VEIVDLLAPFIVLNGHGLTFSSKFARIVFQKEYGAVSDDHVRVMLLYSVSWHVWVVQHLYTLGIVLCRLVVRYVTTQKVNAYFVVRILYI
jgi:hypothetical protein